MHSIAKALLAGAAGAISVTLLHECTRKVYRGAPRLDKLGEQALQKTAKALNAPAPAGSSLYEASMTADLISNTLYYSAAGFGKGSSLIRATALGLAAGIGAVTLPDKMHLDGALTAATPQRRWITIGLYTFGGLLTGLILQHQRKN